MKNKKKVMMVSILALVILVIIGTTTICFDKLKNKSIKSSEHIEQENSSHMAMMYETEAGSGEYISSNNTTWPEGDYVFNDKLSKCEQGSELSWNETTKSVVVKGSISDKCYIYFDVKTVPTLANYIKSLYTTDGENGLYLHDADLNNGVNDGSYRYVGRYPDNYVCFGTDEETCSFANLYRIIGVFDDKVKLIKFSASKDLLGENGDYYGLYDEAEGNTEYGQSIYLYFFNYKNNTEINDRKGSNDWNTSLLNTVNLNTNFINNIGTKWSNMIASSTWYIGGVSKSETFASAYKSERKQESEVKSKIGLESLSDVLYAFPQKYWNLKISDIVYNSIDNSIYNSNWFTDFDEFESNLLTITPEYGTLSNLLAWSDMDGEIISHVSYYPIKINLSFYLESNVKLIDGTGTKTDPYRIS